MQHVRQHRLDCVVGALHVDGEIAVPVRLRHILELHLSGDARVADQQRDGAEFPPRLLRHGLHSGLVRHIGPVNHGPAALGGEEGAKLLRLVLSLQIVDADCPAGPRQCRCHGPADSPGRPGDNCGFVHFAVLLLPWIVSVICGPPPGWSHCRGLRPGARAPSASMPRRWDRSSRGASRGFPRRCTFR